MGTRREQVDIRARSNLAAVASKDAIAVRGLANSADSLSRSAVQSDRASQRMADGGLQRVGTTAQTTAAKVQRAVTSLAAAEAAATKARNTVADATGRVRVAEQRLAELRDNGNVKQSQLIAGEEALAKARRELAEASVRAHTATERLVEVNAPVAPSMDRVTESTTQAARSTRQADTSINQLTGRIRALAQAAIVLGPALIPIGALAVPALTGLATQLGFVAASGGTAILAFQGVGDSITALNEALKDPTADNIAKARTELEGLSPAARQFALGIGDMRDEWIATRDAAAEGLFPGLTRSLDSVDDLLPRLQDILREVGDTTGDLIADGAASLASDRWAPFFDYLERQARPTLENFAAAFGNLGHGIAETLMALDPASQDFGQWLENITGNFDEWAQGLAGSDGLESFMDYLAETGPQVADTMGAIASAAGQIVQAASPLGGPVLAGLELAADAIGAIADTSVGSKLITMAAAFIALSKAMGLVAKVAGAAGFAGLAAKAGGALGGVAKNADTATRSTTTLAGRLDTARTNMRQLGADARTMGTTVMTAGARSSREMQRFNDAAARTRSTLGGYAKTAGIGAAGAAAFALASTDLGESLGVQNTAMLGLMGSLLGPWGVAIGAGVGAVLDFKAANDDLEASTRAAQQAIDSQSMAGMDAEFANLSDQLRTTQDDIDNFWSDFISPSGIDNNFNALSAIFGGADDEAREQAQAIQDIKTAFSDLGTNLNLPDDMLLDLTQVAERAAPALKALGYDYNDLRDTFNSDPLGEGAWGEMQQEIADYMVSLDSAEGRTQALSDAMQTLGVQGLANADSAQQLASALNGVFAPTLAAEEATHAWRASLQAIRDLDPAAGFGSMTEASRANAAATRTAVEATEAMLVARAADGAGRREIAGLVQQSRRDFIAEGVAAGKSAEEMRRRANALELTPKLVRTVFDAANIGIVEAKARDLKATYKGMPKEVRARIRADNIPATEKGIDRLVRKYKLTERQRTALVRIRDLASRNVDQLLRGLGAVDRKKTNPRITVDQSQAIKGTNTTRARLDEIGGRRTTAKIGADTGAANRGMSDVERQRQGLARSNTQVRVGADVGGANSGINSVRSNLRSLDGDTATTRTTHYVTTVNTTVNKTVRRAQGGYVRGPGTTTSDSIPALLSDKEYVVNAAATARYGVAMMDDINAMRFADGGLASRERTGVAAALRAGDSSGVGVAVRVSGDVFVNTPDGRRMPLDLDAVIDNRLAAHRAADDDRAYANSTRTYDGSGV